jgi:TonB-linked SusC/RagA family outer membrane protein
MDKTNLIKGTVMPFAMMCSVMLFTPPMAGMQNAYASVQQQGTVTGTVVDSQGEPIIGASVVILGGKTVQGTVTDFDGNFTLKVAPGTQLKISYVGYKDLTVKATNNMKLTLEEESTMLQGVEVVAYGVQKKVTVTGALSSVKSEDLVRTPVSSVNNVLAGQLSGVTTVQYSGEPGSDAASIFVRGKATWVDANPLVQVDGVEREMWDIDPNEIESITVLKDASATAVFGVRGANGVILITTKRGQEGKARITANASFSAVTATKMIEMANSYEYATFYNKMLANDGKSPQFTDYVINKFATGSDPVRFPSMDWADYIMKDVTLQQQHNINISGGNNKVKYFISAGFYSQDGLFEQFGTDYDYGYQYQRFNYRANIDLNVTKSTLLSLNVSGKVDDKNSPRTGQGSGGMIKAIYQATPFVSPGIVDGKYIINSAAAADNLAFNDHPENMLPFTGESPMTYYAYQPGAYQDNSNKLSFDLILDQKLDFITKGLSAKIKGSYNSSFSTRRTITAGIANYTPILQADNQSIIYRKNGDTTPPAYSSGALGSGRNWYVEGSLSYNRAFGLHTVSALALYNQSKEYYISGEYVDVPRTYVGLVGRVTYDYNNRYIAEFNIGYNGSENFAPGKRFGVFPAGSVGYVVSEEPFFKPLKKVVSFLKFRASWGLVGNDKIGGKRFMYVADPYLVNTTALAERIGKDTNPYAYNFGVENGTVAKGAVESSKNNPDVSWETAFKQDYGIDINFLDDRLRANFDYFRENRKDILVQDLTAPRVIGFTVPYSNLGEVKSWGWEASLNWQDKIGKDFRYWAKFNISYNQNEIIEKYETPQAHEYMYERGKRIGSRSLYKFWKFYYPGAEADYEREFGTKFPTQFVGQLQPGDAVYVDLNGDGLIDGNDMFRGNAYTDDPEYIAGLTLGFQWKQWSFNTQLTAAWNVTRLISDVFRQPYYSAGSNTSGGLLKYHLDHTWSAENPSQDAEYPRATWDNAKQNYANATLYEKDAKYFRVKTVQIAYDFNFPFMKTLGLNQLQLAISGYNLLTFSPYIWGDPEARASNAPSYPLQRTFTASLKLGF